MKTIRAVSAVTLSLVAFSAVAQETVRSVATRSSHAVKSSPIRTQDFYPKIDATYSPYLAEPENPMGRLEIGPTNNLKPGGLLKESRGAKKSYFPAIDMTGWYPPDCTLGVGTTHIVATVNSSIAFFNKAGTKQFQQTLDTFFAGLRDTSFLFDPKVFWDRIHQRFVMIVPEKAAPFSNILMAVSDDADPNGTWHRYKFDVVISENNATYWLDYPGYGYNKDSFIISGNMFRLTGDVNTTPSWAGVQFLYVPVTPTLTGAAVTPFKDRDVNSGTVQIAEMIDPNVDKVFGINTWNTARLGFYAFQNLTTTPTWTRTLITIPAFNWPSRQANSTNGKTLDSLDGRIYNASWRNGKLVAAHTITSGNLAARWYEINTNSWPTSGSPSLSQSGNVSGADDYHMPAISQNVWGDIGMIFTRSSSSITADLMYSARYSTDAAGTMGAPVLLENSAGNSYGLERWGDYFKMEVDPVDDTTFWGIGMTVNAGNNWRTSIYSWSLAVPVSGQIKQNSVGVPGVVVRVEDAGGNLITSATTDSNGDYSVNVGAGTWTLRPTHNDKLFFPSTKSVTTPPAASTQNFTAGNIGPISIVFEYGAVVYSDQSRRGVLGLNIETPVQRDIAMSDNSFKLTSPVKVTVPAGIRQKEFFVYGVTVTSDTLVTVTATHQGLTATGNITVRAKPVLTGFSLPATIKGGRGVTGTVSTDKPAIAPMKLDILSSDTGLATVSPSATSMPNGMSTKSFYVKTFPVATTQQVTITANFYGSTVTHNLSVTP